MQRLRALAVIAAVGLVPTTTAAAQAAGWAAPQTVTGSGSGYDTGSVAVAPDGRVVAALNSGGPTPTGSPLDVFERTPGGAWTGLGKAGSAVRVDPSIAATDDATTVGWVSGSSSPQATSNIASAPPGSGFGDPSSSTPGSSAPVFATSSDGWTVAAWDVLRTAPTGEGFMLAERPPGGSFEAPVFFPAKGGSGHPSVAVSTGGRAVATWATAANPSVIAVVRAAGAVPWGTAQGIGTGTGTYQASAGLDAAGHAVVTWIRSGGDVVAVTLRGGVWSAPQVLGIGGWGVPQVAVNEAGAAVILWSDNGILRIVRRSSADDDFGTPVSPPGGCAVPPLGGPARFGGGGDAMVVWQQSYVNDVGAVVLSADGSLHPLETLSAPAGSSRALLGWGVDGVGDVTALYRTATAGAYDVSSVTTTAPISALATTLPAVDPVDCPLPPGARPTQTAPLPAAVSPALRLLTTHALTRTGADLGVPVRCPKTTRMCRGTLTVRTRGRQIGALDFALAAGSVRTLKVSVGRRTAMRSVQLRATTTADQARQTVTRATIAVRGVR